MIISTILGYFEKKHKKSKKKDIRSSSDQKILIFVKHTLNFGTFRFFQLMLVNSKLL